MMWDIIRKLEDQLWEELEDACEYMKCAMKMKSDDPVVADLYYNMANQEMNHYNNLHTVLHNKVHQMEDNNNMKIIYDYLDGKHTGRVARIKAMMLAYKE